MEMKKLSQIIRENLNASICNFINEDITEKTPNNIIEDFSINLNVYFDNEKQKLIRKIKLGERMKNQVRQYNDIIMNLGYTYSQIKTNENRGEYNISYYIDGSENWGDDEFIDNEYQITTRFNKNIFDITVGVSDSEGKAVITLSFSVDVIDMIDI